MKYLLVVLLLLTPAFAENDNPHKRRAQTLYYLVKFITWPEGTFADKFSPINICILDSTAIDKYAVEHIRRKRAAGRKLVLSFHDSVYTIGDCQLIYVEKISKNRLGKLLRIVEKKSIFLVSEKESLSAEDSDVIFDDTSDRRVKIGRQTLKNKGFRVHSELDSLLNTAH